MAAISGRTKLCGIFGYPVEHSLSPAMHNAAFTNMDLDWAYVPFLVRPADLPQAVAAVRALNMAGVNVTVPHKQAVMEFLDKYSPAALLAGAVNTIVNSGGVLTGHNTDGEGFIRFLREEAGISLLNKPCLILGAGGAARAVALSLALSGSPAIIIANRSEDRAAELCNHIKNNTGSEASVLKWAGISGQTKSAHRDWAAALESVGLIVQTTPLGMHHREGEIPPIPFNLIKNSHVAVDLIYSPARTGFMKMCEAAGAAVFNGLGMLVHQGVIAFELWTGQPPPVEVMRRALQNELSAVSP
jgi:shikimate dehydrogenase